MSFTFRNPVDEAIRGVAALFQNPRPKLGARPFGLTWEDECSREAHQQMYRYFMGQDPPADWFKNDPPSKTRPPAR